MGNSNTKESRPGYPDGFTEGREHRTALGTPSGHGFDPPILYRYPVGRTEQSFLGLGNGSSSRRAERPDAPFEHRETKQEREARKLERERAVRAKERERSLKEEHVDGGYLVTLGTYTGTEDFSKPVVRHLQIDRKMAPFWRGLNDWSDNWAEHQIIAAARGLPVPAADAPPDPDLVPQPPPPSDPLPGQSLNNLTVEIGPRTLSTASDMSGSGAGSALPSPSTAGPSKGSIKPRARALAAALSVGSRNASSTDLAPKEIQLPYDPFVNGQPLEVFLYKDASECPICFLTYPPYLNHTRCCDQPICSECFVQIKRTDPHLPEHHPDGQTRAPNEGLNPEDPPEMLISEPSACPYCQQPEFGVTYEPPPFRRGLLLSTSSSNMPSSTAMSSQTSLNSTLSPASPNPTGRRRAHSLSANAPNVITTDRVRPDWATKLASARAHQARRAAAATALHTAAFLMSGTETRSRLRPGRFSRRNTGSNSGGTSTPGVPTNGAAADASDGPEPGERSSSVNPDGTRRNRMDELEDMMFMEAVRLSLAAEEERKRKMEKAYRKEAKKREQAERKALKKQAKDPYGGGLSGASASSLSLGLGRKRGNSAASNLRLESSFPTGSQSPRGTQTPPTPDTETRLESAGSKGKGVDRGQQDGAAESTSTASLPIPTSSNRGLSHLRQISNASSLGSSPADSLSGSYTGPGGSDAAKRLSVGNRSDDGDRDTETEPMFNFRSLAEVVGVNIDDGSVTRKDDCQDSPARPLSQVKEEEKEEAEAEHFEGLSNMNIPRIGSLSLLTKEGKSGHDASFHLGLPELTITPETPAADDDVGESKRLGEPSVSERVSAQAIQ